MKLKTLKDTVDDCDIIVSNYFIKSLKQDAIKWIKELDILLKLYNKYYETYTDRINKGKKPTKDYLTHRKAFYEGKEKFAKETEIDMKLLGYNNLMAYKFIIMHRNNITEEDIKKFEEVNK